MPYAEVSVNSPAATRPTFSYRVPGDLEVLPGQAVWVPFGKQLLQGIVVSVGDSPEYPETRDIEGLAEGTPVLPEASIRLAKWIADYYRCPLFQALALMLPPGFERGSICFLVPVVSPVSNGPGDLGDIEHILLEKIRAAGRLPLKHAEKEFSIRAAARATSTLCQLQLIERTYDVERPRIKPKLETYIQPAADTQTTLDMAASLLKRSPKQSSLLSYLAAAEAPVALRQAKEATGCSPAVINTLAGKGLIRLTSCEQFRRPVLFSATSPEPPLHPTAAQHNALQAITREMDQSSGQIFLLHGITGSGKTEVYLQTLQTAIKTGKRAIVLVPEISLTTQTIERFTARFPNQVAVLHSRLSLGEQFDQWREIAAGEYSVVIGPRSALFAPQPDLGLIVIDEEHEWTYKQDTAPRYHARMVAAEIARLSGAVVILGSATPDVESFYHARSGRYRQLDMPERLTEQTGSALPAVEIVDLRDELKAGNRSIFSYRLQSAIKQALDRKEQVILFLNRRGGATFVQCRTCGHVVNCRRCRVPMSFHFEGQLLVCHQCNYRAQPPESCPTCSSQRIKYLGLGTQAVEAEAARLFPLARTSRWDSDATRIKNSHQALHQVFATGQADILVGTQMVAKGLDFPNVSLVGVINADTVLNLPDFRAGERTFALLSQVAGRAGRSAKPGTVIIQSYFPRHYAIQAAAGNNYLDFYNTEIQYRKELNQPPFSRLVRLTFQHTNDEICQREALRLKKQLSEARDEHGLASTSLIGPAPSFVQRLRGRYRWSIIIKGSNPAELLNLVELPRNWRVDVDPYGLE